MEMRDKPQQQFKEAREQLRLTQAEVASKVGISHRLYQRIESGIFPKFKSDTIKEIDKILGTNVYEIIYERKNPRETSQEPVVPYQQKRLNQKNTDEEFLVPFVDIPAQAGYSKAYQQRDYITALKKYPILPDVDPTGLTWRYFQVEGDSMEPEIQSGDIILCSLVNKEDWQNITNYYTHVIVTEDSLWIKDVVKKSKDVWYLVSQNPEHKAFAVSVGNILQVWVMRRHIKSRAKKHRMYSIEEIEREINSGKSKSPSDKTPSPNPFQKVVVGKKK